MGWITEDRERISIRKEMEWLESYMAWVHEDANLSRRAHSALLQHQIHGATFGICIFIGLLHYNAPSWQFLLLAGAWGWWSYWPFGHLEKANKAVEDHADKRPSTEYEGNFFAKEEP
jgi:hypothetical protein